MPPAPTQLVDAKELLRILFTEDSRPSLRWLRGMQKKRLVPFEKVGRSVFFDPEQVRRYWAKRNAVMPRGGGRKERRAA